MRNAPTGMTNESVRDDAHSTTFDLFPDTIPPVPPAIWPEFGTVRYDVLISFLKGPQNQANTRITWRLAAVVHSLAEDGWVFTSRFTDHPWRAGIRIKEYAIDRQAPANFAAIERHFKKRRGGQRGSADLLQLLVVAVVVGQAVGYLLSVVTP